MKKKKKSAATKKNPGGQVPAPMTQMHQKRRRVLIRTFNQRGGIGKNTS